MLIFNAQLLHLIKYTYCAIFNSIILIAKDIIEFGIYHNVRYILLSCVHCRPNSIAGSLRNCIGLFLAQVTELPFNPYILDSTSDLDTFSLSLKNDNS